MKLCPKCLQQFDDEAHQFCPDDGTELRAFNDQAIQLPGKILDGRWLIEEKIGEGGMGEVFRGKQVSVDREVAIKVLRPAMAVSEEYVSRFFREANMASQISHPNFVTLYDFGQAEGLQILYLAMEYLSGQDLADRMREARMGLNHILQIASQCCAALSAAHAANIVHRDLKPENVFLMDTPNGEIQLKVLDFGIAKELGATTSMTRTGQIFGTPEYMSPEQCQSNSELDGRSDLYSLGCILYELISGRSPFQRDSVIQTLLAQVSEPVRDLRSFRFSIPDSTAEIVMTLLKKQPNERYASAEAAKDVIDAEIAWLEANPLVLNEYLDSQRTTAEFDREVNSQANTHGFDDRHTSQLINLEDIDILHETQVKPSRKGAMSALVVLLVLVAGGVAAMASGVFDPEPPLAPEPEPVNARPAISLAGETLERAVKSGGDGVGQDVGAQQARATVIMATSMALVQPETKPSSDKPKRTSRPKKSRTVVGIRTPSTIDKRAKKYTRQLLQCYAKREHVEDGGTFGVKFRIKRDGSVDSIKITKAGFKSPAVESCITNKVARWKFATSIRGAGVDYHERSFTFRPPK